MLPWLEEIEKNRNCTYFPELIFDKNLELHLLKSLWYSNHLMTMREPPILTALDLDIEVYKFLWLCTFDHLISIRIQKYKKELTILVKKLSGQGGYKSGRLVVEDCRELQECERENTIHHFKQASFWKLPSVIEEGGLDGLNGLWREQKMVNTMLIVFALFR